MPILVVGGRELETVSYAQERGGGRGWHRFHDSHCVFWSIRSYILSHQCLSLTSIPLFVHPFHQSFCVLQLIDEESEPLNTNESYVTNNNKNYHHVNGTAAATSWKKWAMATAAIALVGMLGYSNRSNSSSSNVSSADLPVLGKSHSKADKAMKEQQLFDEHRELLFI